MRLLANSASIFALLSCTLLSGLACSDPSGSRTIPESSIWLTESLPKAVGHTPVLILEEETEPDHSGEGEILNILHSQDELTRLFPEAYIEVDFSSHTLLVASTPSTGGCFSGFSISRVEENDTEVQIFLRSSNAATGREMDTFCTADIRNGFNRFYLVPVFPSEKTIQTVTYSCSDENTCRPQ